MADLVYAENRQALERGTGIKVERIDRANLGRIDADALSHLEILQHLARSNRIPINYVLRIKGTGQFTVFDKDIPVEVAKRVDKQRQVITVPINEEPFTSSHPTLVAYLVNGTHMFLLPNDEKKEP